MRIIAGNYKGKKIFFPKTKHTRPLRDLVKESIFNLIENSNKFDIKIKDSNVLDLFSGSGSFGLECISREAKKVTFVENYFDSLFGTIFISIFLFFVNSFLGKNYLNIKTLK